MSVKKKPFEGLELKHNSFSYETFENCDFTQRDCTGSRFLECRFLACNLSLVKLDGCRLQDVRFENCKLVGVNFTKCDKMFLCLKFNNCLIDTSNFSDLDLKNTSFCGCVIRDTHFTNTNLISADFEGVDLKGSVFHNTNLSKANFRGAINYLINPSTNKLVKARFSAPEVLALLDHFEIIIE